MGHKKKLSPNSRSFLKPIVSRNESQREFLSLIDELGLVFGLGPAGVGKTFCAVAKAVEALLTKQAEHIIVSRPILEAGEHLGFLPCGIRDKVDPYFRPIYDILHSL